MHNVSEEDGLKRTQRVRRQIGKNRKTVILNITFNELDRGLVEKFFACFNIYSTLKSIV